MYHDIIPLAPRCCVLFHSFSPDQSRSGVDRTGSCISRVGFVNPEWPFVRVRTRSIPGERTPFIPFEPGHEPVGRGGSSFPRVWFGGPPGHESSDIRDRSVRHEPSHPRIMATRMALLALSAVTWIVQAQEGREEPFFATFVDGPQRVLQVYNPSCSPLDLSRMQVEVLWNAEEHEKGTSMALWGFSDNIFKLTEAHVPPGASKGERKVAPRDVFVLCGEGGEDQGENRPDCDSCTNHLRCDAYSKVLQESGDGSKGKPEKLAIGLYLDGELVDTIGMENDMKSMIPTGEWTFVRKPKVSHGSVSDWNPAGEQEGTPQNKEWTILPYSTMAYIDCHSIKDTQECGSTLPQCKSEDKTKLRTINIRNINGNFQAEELESMQCSPNMFGSPFAGEMVGTAGVVTHIAHDARGNTRVYLQSGYSPFGALAVDGHTHAGHLPPVDSKVTATGRVSTSKKEGIWLDAIEGVPDETNTDFSSLMSSLSVPRSTLLKTGTFSRTSCSNKAQAYKGMLVKFQDVVVTQLPSGKTFLSDGSGYVEMRSAMGPRTSGEDLVLSSLAEGLNHISEIKTIIDNIEGNWVAFPRTADDVITLSEATAPEQERDDVGTSAENANEEESDSSNSSKNVALNTAAAVLLGIVVGAATVVLVGLLSYYGWHWYKSVQAKKIGQLKRRQSIIPFMTGRASSDEKVDEEVEGV